MKKIYKYTAKILMAFAAVGLTGCDSFLQEYSQDLAKVESWEDLDEVLLGSVYARPGRYYVENYTGYVEQDLPLDILHFMSDEIQFIDSNDNDVNEYYRDMFSFYTWQQDTGIDNQLRYSGGDEKYWNNLYDRINVCNMILALIDEQSEKNPTDAIEKQRVKGETSFMRGLMYFMLTNLYAKPYDPATASMTPGVPLKTTEFVEDRDFQRASLSETYEQILADLNEADRCLNGLTRKTRYRVDHTTVLLLLSRVYLYMQNWEKAMSYANEVLKKNSQLMSLGSKTPGATCLDGSCVETLFFMGDYIIAVAFNDRARSIPEMEISADMADLYSMDDYRKNLYIGESQYCGYSPVFRKVNGQREAWGTYSEAGSVFTFRTSEAYLNLAEAAAYAGEEGTAKSTLEHFLATRMKGSVSIDKSGNDLIDFIREERAREFLLEGHRWFDLRRYTVCQPYPWSKEIEHGYFYVSGYRYDHTDWYRLEKNDEAYTLPVPRKIKDFQISLDVIKRPARLPFKTTR